jgi:hypothetical protein
MDPEMESDLMNIKALEKEYNTILKQYEEAYKNCNAKLTDFVDTGSNTIRTFTSFPNRSYWGDDGLKEGSVSNQAACEIMCASDAKCSGATFNSSKNYCWARTGKGELNVSTNGSSDIALIPDITACVITLKALNERMIEINKQLTEAIDKSSPQVESQQQENNIKRDNLHKYYAQLLAERLQMEQLIKDNQTVDSEYETEFLKVEQGDSALRFWITIACILSIIVINQMRGKSATVFSVFWLVIIIILLVLSFKVSQASGFAVWCVMILLIILMKLGIVPSPDRPIEQ